MTIHYKTDPRTRTYTKCAMNKIVGSHACKMCNNFVAKVGENHLTVDGVYVNEGLVECKLESKSYEPN